MKLGAEDGKAKVKIGSIHFTLVQLNLNLVWFCAPKLKPNPANHHFDEWGGELKLKVEAAAAAALMLNIKIVNDER